MTKSTSLLLKRPPAGQLVVKSIDTLLKITMSWLIVVPKSSLESDRHGAIVGVGLVLRLEVRGEEDLTRVEVRMVGADQIEDVMIATGEVEETRGIIGVSGRLDFRLIFREF